MGLEEMMLRGLYTQWLYIAPRSQIEPVIWPSKGITCVVFEKFLSPLRFLSEISWELGRILLSGVDCVALEPMRYWVGLAKSNFET